MNGNVQPLGQGQNGMPMANLSRDSFDANSAVAMGSVDAANKAAIDAANAVNVNASSLGPVAADVNVGNVNTQSDNLVLPKDSVSSDAAVVGIDYGSNAAASASYGYDNSSADYQFRHSIESSASSTIGNDYNYPSLTIDGGSSSAAQSHAFYEQTYATAYEQTYATAYARSAASAESQAQNIQSERQQVAEQKQMEAREQSAQAKSSDMSSQSVRMSSKGVADNRTTNFLTGLVKTATQSKNPPASAPANGGAPQSRARSANPASETANASKPAAGSTPDADWNSHIANEVLKRRARSVKKQSADEKAADLKALRGMTSKMD